MICAVEQDLSRYLRDQDRREDLAAQADELNASELASAKARCLADDELLGSALVDYLAETGRHALLGLAVRCALGQAGFTATNSHLKDLAADAAMHYAEANAERWTEERVEALLEDQKDEARAP